MEPLTASSLAKPPACPDADRNHEEQIYRLRTILGKVLGAFAMGCGIIKMAVTLS